MSDDAGNWADLPDPQPPALESLRPDASVREVVQYLDGIGKSAPEARVHDLEEALRPYLAQHDLSDRDRRCVCSYCNKARALLGSGEEQETT